MQVTLAFRQGTDIVDKALAWWTNCKYTHVEIIIGDKWISSGPTKGGVYINNLYTLNTKWIYVPVEVDGRVLNTVMRFIEEQEGKKYDWSGILLNQFFASARKDDQDKWFCSEIVAEILRRFKSREINLESVKYNPADLLTIYGNGECNETSRNEQSS